MQTMSMEFSIFLFIAIGVGIFGILSLLITATLHRSLYKNLDHILFRTPYFSTAELSMYSVWPLSYIKSLIYMFLIAAPGISKKRRFKEYKSDICFSRTITIFSKTGIFFLFTTSLFGCAFFLYGSLMLLVNN